MDGIRLLIQQPYYNTTQYRLNQETDSTNLVEPWNLFTVKHLIISSLNSWLYDFLKDSIKMYFSQEQTKRI